jgi:hypothetical protein
VDPGEIGRRHATLLIDKDAMPVARSKLHCLSI